jgi:hypothetical protein
MCLSHQHLIAKIYVQRKTRVSFVLFHLMISIFSQESAQKKKRVRPMTPAFVQMTGVGLRVRSSRWMIATMK